MAIRYHFDLYPANNPKSGARQVRFTQLQNAAYRSEANGTGDGQLSLRGSTTDAGFIDPAGNQYVRVVREDTVAATFLVVGGFFLEHGDFEALTEKGTKLLTFGGAGTLAYLDRAIMWSHTYYSHSIDASLGSAYGQDPFDDTWRLSSAGTGTTHGAMLWRAIYEATHFPSAAYQHEHGDGLVYTDTHADDRAANVLSALVYNFTKTADTAGNAWSTSSGEFHVAVGDTLLQVVKKLMEAGLYIDMNPDTFELRAWEGANHGRTRTGVAWGANVIRFQAPTDGTVATGNIKSDAKRGLAARIKRSVVLAGGSDVYGKATSGSNVPWEGFYPAETESATVNAQLASTQLTARNEAGDTARLRFKLGTDPANGSYLPFEHILPDDLATLHSGTASWDWNEAALPVAALTVSLRPGGDWDGFVDLGSTYTDMRSRAFTDSLRQIIRQPGSHTHPPNPQLCDRHQAVATSKQWRSLQLSWSGGTVNAEPADWKTAGFDDADWESGYVPPDPDAAWVDIANADYLSNRAARDDNRLESAVWITRYEFVLGAAPSKDVTLTWNSDDTVQAWLNGTQIIAAGSGSAATTYTTTISAGTFAAGTNCLAIKVTNSNQAVDDWANNPTMVQAVMQITDVLLGGSSVHASRCDHNHYHNALLGRDRAGAHPQYTLRSELETAGHYEVLMADGITNPPDPVTNEAGDDWLVGWVS